MNDRSSSFLDDEDVRAAFKVLAGVIYEKQMELEEWLYEKIGVPFPSCEDKKAPQITKACLGAIVDSVGNILKGCVPTTDAHGNLVISKACLTALLDGVNDVVKNCVGTSVTR